MRKTWHQKYLVRRKPELVVAEKSFGDIPAGAQVVISTPAEVDRAVRLVPAGHELTMKQLRNYIARKHHVQYTCPITTGIFLRIASECAVEDLAHGKTICQVMPFWRIVTPRSTIGKKLACGQDFITQMRANEGLPV